jgi:chemotaxis protein MotB
MSVSGYADTRPLDNNGTAAGRGRNRRIEIIVDGAS